MTGLSSQAEDFGTPIFFARGDLLFVNASQLGPAREGQEVRILRTGRVVGRAEVERNRGEFGHVVLRRREGEAREGDRAYLVPGSPARPTPPPSASAAGEAPVPPPPGEEYPRSMRSDSLPPPPAAWLASSPAPESGADVPPIAVALPPPLRPSARETSPLFSPVGRMRILAFPLAHPDSDVRYDFETRILPEWSDTYEILPVSGEFRANELPYLLNSADAGGALVPTWEEGRLTIDLYDGGGRNVFSWQRWMIPFPRITSAPGAGDWGPFRVEKELAGLAWSVQNVLPFGRDALLVRDSDAVYEIGEETFDLRRVIQAPRGSKGLYRFGDRLAVRRGEAWLFLDEMSGAERWRAEAVPWDLPVSFEDPVGEAAREENRRRRREDQTSGPRPAAPPASRTEAQEKGRWADLDGDGEIDVVLRRGEAIEIYLPDEEGYRLRFRSPEMPGLSGLEVRPSAERNAPGDELWLLVRGRDGVRVLVLGGARFPSSGRLEE